ncbi:MAG: hypothetical protein AB8B63_18320 [Granulosicoccus sp.]
MTIGTRIKNSTDSLLKKLRNVKVPGRKTITTMRENAASKKRFNATPEVIDDIKS